MIRQFLNEQGRLRPADATPDLPEALVWIDLFNPTRDEETTLEERLGVDLPTREEMEEIEISSRLYNEDGASFMTALLPANADSGDPVMYS